jgi:hypothetical protein
VIEFDYANRLYKLAKVLQHRQHYQPLKKFETYFTVTGEEVKREPNK